MYYPYIYPCSFDDELVKCFDVRHAKPFQNFDEVAVSD